MSDVQPGVDRFFAAFCDWYEKADADWKERRLAYQAARLVCTSPGGPEDCYDIDCPSPMCNSATDRIERFDSVPFDEADEWYAQQVELMKERAPA